MCHIKIIIIFKTCNTIFVMKKALKKTTTPITKELETKYKQLVERAYNLKQTDDSLSDMLYFEAERLLQKLKGKTTDIETA